ncbi:MAG: hypothetical protein OMM_06493 [Candidatus Magnetoglobus multicellularis str. Araruama]|uniref:Uncharacterized protein n=1 Tax=Candidatus Magnetoglobus multicellularis str. Araruama TaxID=890399 RepID=A0A1V1PGZ7_9BACT|nr:MAG: hypothetical protein OMM_06493 [Candidatus Magnetoglobus multicellularis str. Araruama]
MDKADEFIYVDGLAQLVESNDLDQWKICYIENLTGKEHIYNHLIIDSVSVGQKTWSRMISQMHMHLNESLL